MTHGQASGQETFVIVVTGVGYNGLVGLDGVVCHVEVGLGANVRSENQKVFIL